MNQWLRRRARLLAGSLALVVLAGVAFVGHSAGSDAQPARAVRQVHAIAPVLAPVSQRRLSAAAGGPAASASGAASRRRGAAATAVALSGRGRRRTGLPTPAPSARTLANSLQQITGLSPAQVSSRAVCPPAASGRVTCGAQALVLRSNGSLVHPHVSRYSALGRVRPASARGVAAVEPSGATAPDPGTPGYLQQAYDLAYLSQKDASSDTVAIVDAFDDPTAEGDLATYRSTYGLPVCSTGNGCLQKIGQDSTSSPPRASLAWEQEISLDLDAVSAICPNCHILLVEANSDNFSDLQAAMATAAATPGVKQIVASWWGTASTVPAGLTTFDGIATVAATGDQGYAGAGQNNYPAALPGVTAAGGTSLTPAAAAGARGFGESAWSFNGLTGGGSGCDRHFPRPAYQPADGCVGRAYADLSADGNPDTGLKVYDSNSGDNQNHWIVLGGTSLSAPLVAAYYAITGVDGTTPEWAYGKAGDLNDVLSGSTGLCAASIAYICNAGAGYDGPTGVGSISGSAVTGAPGIDGPAFPGNPGQGNTYTQGVAPHGATIAGGIYRNGLDTQWSIEYGTDNTYGSHTAQVDIGAGSAPVSVTGYLSQLTPNTTYHYRLVAQNSLGTTYGYDYTFTTQAAPDDVPTAAFTFSRGSGDDFSFDASASSAPSGSITDYSWNFGDGSTDDTGSNSDSHTYNARGTYTVTLTVKTDGGQTDTSRQRVTVDNPPTATITVSDDAVPTGGTVAFDGSTSTADEGGSITDYSWDFGDGTSAVDGGADATASHTFTAPGTYTVTLTTTDDLDVIGTTTQMITVAPFTVSAPIPAPDDDVTFIAGSPDDACGTVTGYTWNFGDGTPPETGPDRTVVHNFTDRRSYTVSLSFQCSDAQVPDSFATVIVDTPPTAAFTPPPTAVQPGTPVVLDAGGSSAGDVGGSITHYTWSFGDGSAAIDKGTTDTITHTFTTPGLYTVMLTTTDDMGVSGTVSHDVTVDQPTAAFTVSASPTQNFPVTFDARATDDPESTITHYTWNFGDGSSVDAGTAPITTHAFSAVGTYTVKLTVTDKFGFTDTTSRQVAVAAPVSETSNPPTTSTSPTPPAPVVTTPTPTPPSSVTPTPPPLALVARLSVGGRQQLTRVLSHGIRLGLTVNQRVRASWQVTLPLAQTKRTRHTVRRARDNAQLIVVLLRRAQTLAPGSHTITLKLSRAAIRRLAPRGSLVLTIRVTLTTTDGRTLTRTAKLRLTRH